MDFNIFLLSLNLALFAFLFLFNFNKLRDELGKIRNYVWLLLFIIFLTGLFLRIPPNMAHIYYEDETHNMEAAKNILLRGEQKLCYFVGLDEQYCYLHNLTGTWGFPFLMSVIFLFFGISSFAVFYTSLLLSALSIFLIFGVCLLMFRNEEIGLWSALLLALNPVHICWSATAKSYVTSIFFVLFTLLLLMLYLKGRNKGMLYLSMLTLAFTINLRGENILLLLVFGIMFLVFEKNLKKTIINKHFLFSVIILAILLIPYFSAMSNAVQSSYLFASTLESIMSSVENLGKTWLEWSFIHLFSSRFIPATLSLFAVLSLIFIRKNKKEILFLIFWFFVFYSFIMVVQSYFFYGKTWRFEIPHPANLLICYIPLTILSSYGLSKIISHAKRYVTIKILYLIFVLLIVFSFYPNVTETLNIFNDTPWHYRVFETRIHQIASRDIENGCYLITEFPSVFNSRTDIKTIKTKYAYLNYDKIENIINSTNCVFALEDMFYLEPEWAKRNRRNFELLNKTYVLELYKSYNYDSIVFRLYSVTSLEGKTNLLEIDKIKSLY